VRRTWCRGLDDAGRKRSATWLAAQNTNTEKLTQ
jgi:hypothetical protein